MANHDQYDLDMLKTLKRIANALEALNKNAEKITYVKICDQKWHDGRFDDYDGKTKGGNENGC